MTEQPLSEDVLSLHSSVLDHASEFVELVYLEAPARYRALLDSQRFEMQLQQKNTFNHGKLFAYAEFIVFREEFRKRFPEASRSACINAFSKLFLKNDISITNLLNYLESTQDQEKQLLNRPGGAPPSALLE